MKKQLSDEQLDAMMATLLNDAAIDDAAVKEIADSPTIWWSVQREINKQKELSVSPWPPIGKLFRWLAIAVPVAAVLAIVIGIFVSRPPGGSEGLAGGQQHISEEPVVKPVSAGVEQAPPANVLNNGNNNEAAVRTSVTPRTNSTKAIVRTANFKNPAKKKIDTQVAQAGETRTDFIALSYARNPDSGQIVRVKVPSSMMVTLGLVASVEKPSNLVDAEVLVGDDGLTRAIRFIR